MKKIFIYFSNSGNGDFVGEILKSNGYEILKLNTKKQMKKMGFFRMMFYGMRASFGKKEKLLPYSFSKEQYDQIVIGSPIWADRVSTPVNTFLCEQDLSNKRIAFILYSGGGGCKKGTEDIKKKFEDARIINLKMPLLNKEATVKALSSK
ncbi:MAG: flavodoxin [Bacilli bacterium]|jgi:hypothetical protein